MYRLYLFAAMLVFGASGLYATPALFNDPLDVSAPAYKAVSRNPLFDVASAGDRLIAVGSRGLIIISDDKGESWAQVEAPVSIDLLAVHFPTSTKGWIVGHAGVVLHSSDGGSSWHRQFDGREAGTLLIKHFEKLAASGDADGEFFLEEVKLNYANGAEQALLDVWFEDERNGFVVGSFGTLFATQDGGRTWESWMERVDTDMLFHYNAIQGVGEHIYIASEQGTVFKLDRAEQRFVPKETGYSGSFFGLVGEADTLIVFGLQGNAYRSSDAGETWTAIDTGLGATLTGGTVLEHGKALLTSQNGRIAISEPAFGAFSPVPIDRPMLFTGATQVSGKSAAIVGLAGVQQLELQ